MFRPGHFSTGREFTPGDFRSNFRRRYRNAFRWHPKYTMPWGMKFAMARF